METLKFNLVLRVSIWKLLNLKVLFFEAQPFYFPRPSPPKLISRGPYKFISRGPAHQNKTPRPSPRGGRGHINSFSEAQSTKKTKSVFAFAHSKQAPPISFLGHPPFVFFLPITKTKRLPLVIFFIEGALNAKNTFKILFCCVDPNHQNFEKPKADFGERLVRQNPWPNSKTPSTKPIRGPRAQDPA